MSEDKIRFIAVVGPTASGKTELAVSLAEALDGEVLSCDSMQIYRGMDIGTAKPTPAERRGIPHHLIDIVDPDAPFSCADYKRLAEQTLREVAARGKTPVFCGGTGLYLDAVISVASFSPEIPDGVRQELNALSPELLWEELCRVDPEAAAKTHRNNRKRVIRALEIYRGTGKTKTEWDRLSRLAPSPYEPLLIGPDFLDRSLLYRRIDDRVDQMLRLGLLEEAAALNLDRRSTAAQAIGYKELYLYLDGALDLDSAVALLKKNTRNYAKRQLTWFRRYPSLRRFYRDAPDSGDNFKNIVNIAERHLTCPPRRAILE